MDIVEKLREIHAIGRIDDCRHSTQVCEDAANEIVRLRGAEALIEAERDACKARVFEVIGWHRNDYNAAQIDPIVDELHRALYRLR